MEKENGIGREIAIGTTASIVLAGLYFYIVSLAQGFSHALEQFLSLWYLMLPLIIGFGVQVGMFAHIKQKLNDRKATASVAAAVGMSTGSMIACCAHHLTDILLIIGISGAAIFLSQYQVFFIILGILSNFIGMLFMLSIMQKHRLYAKKGFMERIEGISLAQVRNIGISVAAVLLITAFFTTKGIMATAPLQIRGQTQEPVYALLSDQQNNVLVEAQPIALQQGENAAFFLRFTTHSGSLDFDLLNEVYIQENGGRDITPLQWEGSLPGGHHRSGNLLFPPLSEGTKDVRLVIKESVGIGERVFTWDIN